MIPLAALDALATAEPWLAPICTRVRELITSGFGDSRFVRESLRYIADSFAREQGSSLARAVG
jgi:hypothetical protein